CGLAISAPQFEFAKRCEVERIGGKAFSVRNGEYLLQAPIWPFVLSDGDGPVQRNDRRRAYRHQRIVESDDCLPVRVLHPRSTSVNGCNRRLPLIFGKGGPG